MALLEEPNTCCICDQYKTLIRIGVIPAYYCKSCYEANRTDIMQDTPWLHYLMNAEKQRRKRRNRFIAKNIPLVAYSLNV